MKRKLIPILGALSMCCFLSTHMKAAEVTKGACSYTESSCKSDPCPQEEAYVTVMGGNTDYGDPSYTVSDSEFLVPLTTIQATKGITLDSDTFTLTVPKGMYSIHFQLMMDTDDNNLPGDQSPAVNAFRFTDIFLDLNNDSTRVALDWSMALNTDYNFSTHSWVSISGSRIFSVGADNTLIKIRMIRDLSQGTYAIRFRSSVDDPSLVPNNNPIRVSLHKINKT